MAKTLKELRESKRKANFIGREKHIQIFQQNLTAVEPHLIFNITRQGGVGKSHLSNRYKKIAEENACLTVFTDKSFKLDTQGAGFTIQTPCPKSPPSPPKYRS